MEFRYPLELKFDAEKQHIDHVHDHVEFYKQVLKQHQQDLKQKINQLELEKLKEASEYKSNLEAYENDRKEFEKKTLKVIQQSFENKYREKQVADRELYEENMTHRIKAETEKIVKEIQAACSEELKDLKLQVEIAKENQSRKGKEEVNLKLQQQTLLQIIDQLKSETSKKASEYEHRIKEEIEKKEKEVQEACSEEIKDLKSQVENQTRKRKYDKIIQPSEGKKFEEDILFTLKQSKLLEKNGIVTEKTKSGFCCDILLNVPSFGKIAIEAKKKTIIEKSDMTRFDRDAIDPKNRFKGAVFWSYQEKIPNVDVEENDCVIKYKRLYLRGVDMGNAVGFIYMYILYLKEIESSSNNHESIILQMFSMWKRNFRAYGELKQKVKKLDEYLKSDLVEIEKMYSGIESFKKEDLKKELNGDLYLATRSHFTKGHGPYQLTQTTSSKSIDKFFKNNKPNI